MDILGSHIFQINPVDVRAVSDIQRHPRRGRNIGYGQLRMLLQFLCVTGRTCKAASRRFRSAFGIHLPHPPHHLKQPGTPRNPVSLQGRRYGKADGLLGTALISHHQIHGKRVESPLHRLHGGIKGLQINRNKFTFLISHFPTPPFPVCFPYPPMLFDTIIAELMFDFNPLFYCPQTAS